MGTALVPVLAERWRVRTYDSQAFGNAIAGTPNVEHVQGDIRDWWALQNALEGVTDVIHLAAIVTDELVDQNPVKAGKINCEAMVGLLYACKKRHIERFILMSSSSIYGITGDVAATELTPPYPMTRYASQKLEQERLALSNANWTPVTIIRSATLCGPAPRMRLDTIVNIFSKQAYFEKVITVHGGDQYRTNVHVADVVDLFVWLLNTPITMINREIFNITAGNHTALEIARIVQKVAGGDIQVDAEKRDPRSYRMSAAKLLNTLGFKPRRTIEDAVRDNLAWFKASGIDDPNIDLWYNNRRMARMMQET